MQKLNRTEALRYMGYGSNLPDEKMTALIDRCEEELLGAVKPKFIFAAFDKDKCPVRLSGNDIAKHLEKSEKVVFMAATLGANADRLIRMAEVREMAQAIILDALASTAIEQVCDDAEKAIHEKFPEYYMTWRYSPGYGDFPIDIQGDFLKVLDAPKKIGLCANSSNILTPRKSVTAVIGLSKEKPEQKKSGCQSCNLKGTCQFRQKGERCGF